MGNQYHLFPCCDAPVCRADWLNQSHNNQSREKQGKQFLLSTFGTWTLNLKTLRPDSHQESKCMIHSGWRSCSTSLVLVVGPRRSQGSASGNIDFYYFCCRYKERLKKRESGLFWSILQGLPKGYHNRDVRSMLHEMLHESRCYIYSRKTIWHPTNPKLLGNIPAAKR